MKEKPYANYTFLNNQYSYPRSLSYKKLELIYKILPFGSSLLDIGCGQGAWAGLALQKFETVTGIEISEEAEKILKERFVNEPRFKFYSGTLEDNLNTLKVSNFDVITVLDVLEHVNAPETVLNEAYDLLKPGGLLIVTTPNWFDFLYSKILRRNPYHIHFHSSLGWSSLLKKSKYQIQFIRTVKFPIFNNEFFCNYCHLLGICVLICGKKPEMLNPE